MKEKIKRILNQQPSENLLIHSDIFHGFALPIPSKNPLELLTNHFKAIKEVTKGKNLIFPAFNYDFLKKKSYNVNHDKSQVGVLSEYFRNSVATYRTTTPVFSFTSEKQLHYTNYSNLIDPFSDESFFQFLVDNNSSMMHYGSPFSSSTFIHHVERISGNLLYRYDKMFKGQIIKDDQITPVSLKYHVRPLNQTLNYRFNFLETELINQEVLKKITQDSTIISIINLSDLKKFWLDKLTDDPLYFLDQATQNWVKTKLDKLGRSFLLNDFE